MSKAEQGFNSPYGQAGVQPGQQGPITHHGDLERSTAALGASAPNTAEDDPRDTGCPFVQLSCLCLFTTFCAFPTSLLVGQCEEQEKPWLYINSAKQ